ncbi:MAG: CvpA family protein [Candidatus Omnitrophota bacterium]|jgi:uncharacterized membrane protein required for colicin V production|nr:MAG: CvpA family protein [Candidatus Omnitrophota bacterium]
MLVESVKNFNWVDILCITLLFRICYIGFKNGFVVEVFKFFGAILAIFISCHYYTVISDSLVKRFGLKSVPLQFVDFIVFAVLVSLSYAISILLRELLSRFIKLEAVQTLNQWGGLALGIARAFLVTGIVVFMLFISSVSYLNNSVKNAFFGKSFINIAPNTYSWIWNNLMSKFLIQDEFNKTILEVQENLKK